MTQHSTNDKGGDVEKMGASVIENTDDLHKTGTVDTLHGDEAAKVLNTYTGERTWSEDEEKRLVRKVDLRLMTILFITGALQFYDKSLLSSAALFGLRQDLQLTTGVRYSFSSSIFYLGYLCGAYPATVLAQRFPIERVFFGIIFLWGACVMCSVACTNFQGLFAQRFFLGFLEAGVSPCSMVILGQWYKKNEQAVRLAIWFAAPAASSLVGPLINYGLGHITGALSPWKYMYLFAGAITVLWAAVALFMDPDPTRARHFNEREKFIAVARLRSNNTGVRNIHFKTEQVWELLLDVKFWLSVLMALFIYIANGPLTTFGPIIINSFGFSTVNSLLLNMPVGAFGVIATLLAGWSAKKIPNGKMYIIIFWELLTMLASCLLWKLPQSAMPAKVVALVLLASYPASYAVLMSLVVANTAGYTKRSASASGLFVGYCLGNFIGPLVFLSKEAPGYPTGWIVVLASAAATCALALLYRVICVRENRRRDDTGIMEGFDNAYEDDLTDKRNPQFRYTY